MSTRAAFISAILANPEDDLLRLIYADWLEENGECVPAAFIRVQCQLARLDATDPYAKELLELEQQQRSLRYDHIDATHLHAMGFRVLGNSNDNRVTSIPLADSSTISVLFNRGLIEAVDVYDGESGAKRFVDNAEDLLSHDPVTRLKFVPLCPYEVSSYYTQEIEYARTTPISDDTLGRLLRVDHMRQVRDLDLSGNPLDEEAVRLLTSSPHLSNLRMLRVGSIIEHVFLMMYDESPFRLPALPAEISAEGRARLEERFGERVIFTP